MVNQGTVLALKGQLLFWTLLQAVGCLFHVREHVAPLTNDRAFLVAVIALPLPYLYIMVAAYVGKSSAKRRLTAWSQTVTLIGLLIPLAPELIRSTTSRPLAIPSSHASDIFTLANLWTSLLIVFSSGMILNLLRRHTLFRLWDTDGPKGREHATAQISLGNAFTLAVLLWMLFFSSVALLPDSQLYNQVKNVLFGDNIIYYLIPLAFAWALVLITSAWFASKSEQQELERLKILLRSHSFKVLKNVEALSILARVRQAFRPTAASQAGHFSDTLLQLVADGRSEELDSTIDRLEFAEYQNLEAYRSFVGTLLTSLPMLGFMGTIAGIMRAIGDFGGVLEGTAAPGELAKSLGGLSLAFETTLLGLIGALVGSYLAALQRRRENSLSLALQQTCQEQILDKATRETRSPNN